MPQSNYLLYFVVYFYCLSFFNLFLIDLTFFSSIALIFNFANPLLHSSCPSFLINLCIFSVFFFSVLFFLNPHCVLLVANFFSSYSPNMAPFNFHTSPLPFLYHIPLLPIYTTLLLCSPRPCPYFYALLFSPSFILSSPFHIFSCLFLFSFLFFPCTYKTST